MCNRLRLLLPLSLLVFITSCRVYKPIARTPVQTTSTTISQDKSVQEYINSYKGLAVSEMNRTGIPASITLAQGIIESDCGRSPLARDANNHFGIKCHDDWTGPTVHHDDNTRNECFRKYGRAADSYYDHSDFLRSVPRYKFLFSYSSSDYKAWAVGLRKAGYATNPDYSNMLIRTIEENNLAQFDRVIIAPDQISSHNIAPRDPVKIQAADSSAKKVIQQTSVMSVMARPQRVMENNRIQYIIVRDGDTREKLENEFQLLRWELPKYNDLKGDFPIVAGQILYLQPKRDKAEAGQEYYNAVEGDTMYLISQKYGIKLKRLYEMNRMEEGTEPEPGRRIWLRSVKPVD
jgi:LysM repeat protein